MVKKTRKYDRDRFLGRVLFYLVAFLVEFFFSWSLSWSSSFFFFSCFLTFLFSFINSRLRTLAWGTHRIIHILLQPLPRNIAPFLTEKNVPLRHYWKYSGHFKGSFSTKASNFIWKLWTRKVFFHKDQPLKVFFFMYPIIHTNTKECLEIFWKANNDGCNALKDLTRHWG